MGTIAAEATLKAIIRKRCDGADTDLLSDDDLDNYLDDAVNRLSEINGRLMLSTLTTVADQQTYQLTGGGASLSNLLGVEQVLYDASNSGILGDEFWDPYFAINPVIVSGVSLFDNPSLVEIYAKKSAYWDQSFEGEWEVFDSGSETYLRLLDAPTSVMTVPYFWWQKRTLTDMEDRFQQKLIDLAVSYCLQSIGRRLEMNPSVEFGGFKGKSSGQRMIESAEKLEMKTEGRLYLPLTPSG